MAGIVDSPGKSSKKRRRSESRNLAVSPGRPAKTAAREKIDASLASGSAGLAILFAYLDQARSGYGDRETALYFLQQAIDAVAAVPMSSSLYVGATGIAWAVAHLRGWFLDADNDATEAMDTLLIDGISRGPWRGSYDLVEGLVGFGVYALEQIHSPSAVQCLAHVINRLDESAERTPDGIAWFTSREVLPDWQRELYPNGYYDLGVAHGVPGVIAFLAQVCALDERKVRGVTETRSKARPLLDGAVAWLLAHRNAASADCVFPKWIGRGSKLTPSRVAWCYGDLGIAAALLATAGCMNSTSWEREAVRLARRVAKRSFAQSGIKDAGLCHGTAGAGHLFNRMFQASSESCLKNAMETWFQHTLKMRHPEGGVAGFAALRIDHWSNEVGILGGAAGIALALLAATTPIEPEWDRMLLLSSPIHAC
ncbi:MAG: lanthionine synthetase C family protein [Candidatus Acidiferrum sp.]